MAKLRLCGHTMGTPHLTPSEAVDFFGRIGYEAIELICDPYYSCSITHQTPREQRKELKSRAAASAVAIGCLTPYVKDVALPDPRLREAAIETLFRYVDLAAELDCHCVRILAGHEVPPSERAAYLERISDSLRRVAAKAAPAGVSLVIENHMDTMAMSAQQTTDVVRAVGDPSVGIIYDPGNLFFMNAEPPEDAISLQAPYIRHVHAKDHVRRDNKVASRVIGEGEIPWREIFSLLKRTGYTGYFSVEYEMRWQPTKLPSPERGFVEGAVALRRMATEVGAYE